jgi:hypothetical protein
VVMCGPTATFFTPLRPLHSSAGFRSQGLRQMTAMTAAPKKENASGQGQGFIVPLARMPLSAFAFISSIRRAESGQRTAAERMPRFANRLGPDYRSPLLHTRCAMTSHPSSSVARTATATATTATATAQCIFMSLLILSNHHHHFITRVSCFAFSWLCFRFRAWELRRAWIGWAWGCIFRHCASPWQMIGIRFSLVMKVTCIFLV